MPGKVMRTDRYHRTDLRRQHQWLFVFGDNMAERGFGGQAKECRGEPNAIGIPTKWQPSMTPDSFFDDDIFEDVKPTIDGAFLELAGHLRKGGTVVWPRDGVGTGLAKLEEKAPAIFKYIQDNLEQLENICNE